MAHLAYVNVFARDIVALAGFYADVFGFSEAVALRSPIFRLLETGRSAIGFNAHEAYALLGLVGRDATAGVRFMLTIGVDAPAEVDARVPVAVGRGAVLLKAPCETYYGTYQAVLEDPEGNVFRIDAKLPARS